VFYLGLGYKKDAAGFWKVKHWGNDNYAALVKMILAENPMNLVYTSGDMGDLQLSINPIMMRVGDPRFKYEPLNLKDSINLVARCGMYVGNDTGMMHVSAACNQKVVGIFKMQNSATKARPWCDTYSCVEAFDLQGNPRLISVEEVFSEIKEMLE
jgi:ADP-heptose:LPS heptosyltransferase